MTGHNFTYLLLTNILETFYIHQRAFRCIFIYSWQLWDPLSSLAFLRLRNNDSQCKIVDAASVNFSVKIFLSFKFKCNFEPFRWRTVIVFPLSVTLMFFSRHKTFKCWFTSNAFSRCWSFRVVTFETETWQAADSSFKAKSMMSLEIFADSLCDGRSFVPTWITLWYGLVLMVGCA